MTARRSGRGPVVRGADGSLVIAWRGLPGEVVGYLLHCLALVWPGMATPVFTNPERLRAEPRDDQIDLVTSEALRQYEAQRGSLAELRSRALAMLTVAITELGLLAATAGSFVANGGWLLAGWAACFLAVGLGLAGMASVASSRATFLDLSMRELLEHDGSIRVFYAQELIGSLKMGSATVNAKITFFRHALTLMVLGALGYGVLWVLTLRV